MLPHRRKERLGARAVDEGRRVLDADRTARSERRRERSTRLGLARHDLNRRSDGGERARDTGSEPAAAPGDEHRGDVVELVGELEPDHAVARHHPLVEDRVDEEPLDAGVGARLHRLPPRVERHRDDRPAQTGDRLELRRRGVVGRDDDRRYAELARDPANALGHVPGARRPDAVPPLVRRGLADRACGAAELERADGLQALELEPDLARRLDVEPDERARGDDVRGHRACALDRFEGDQNGTSSPTPCALARSTQSAAAARSSTASPSDLNTVSSVSSRRPACVPTRSSPSSARM